MAKEIEITGSKKEQYIRSYFKDKLNSEVPKAKVNELFATYELEAHETSVSYGMFNAVVKKLRAEGHGTTKSPAAMSVKVEEAEIICVEDLEFPDFELYVSGKKIDELWSDHEEGGGLYGGTVNIMIGESGVGKSTVSLDVLATIQASKPDAKVLYISSEMTRNDILFYYKKTPAIGKVPTLLLMDYMKSETLHQVLEAEFNKGYDVILLDSFQDTLVKLKEVHNWRATYAESWLTGMMIEASESQGTAIIAIQHMTKGGTYVGSTYLKHATTSMLEIRFDAHGDRYIEFSKNRRGGSAINKRLYYGLNEDGSVKYDVERYTETQELNDLTKNESASRADLDTGFDDFFLKKDTAEETVEAVLPETELKDAGINVITPITDDNDE